MTSNGQVINQRPPMTIANGVMTTARQSNDHKAPTDGQGDLRCEPIIQAGFAAGKLADFSCFRNCRSRFLISAVSNSSAENPLPCAYSANA